jgi:hypothetical protein
MANLFLRSPQRRLSRTIRGAPSSAHVEAARRRWERVEDQTRALSSGCATVGRWALIGRLACASTLTAAFFAPLVSTWATCKPAVAAAMHPPSAVIHMRPFEDLADGSCFPDPPLHLGPIRQEGKLSFPGPLWARMNEAAWRCSDWSSNYLILSTTVDSKGTIGHVEADTGDDEALATCATGFVSHGSPMETRGPGALAIGYFMGRDAPQR